MYESIYVPVDNSEYSDRAADLAIAFGQKFGATVTGSHVYAAKMHDYRFKQMEFTLPEEYLLEDELERQRKIHDSLITMGLELISDSYLDPVCKKCTDAAVPFERRMMDGKHHVEILKDIKESSYDLAVLGVLGLGKTRDSQIGSVCEQVSRYSTKDVLVVKHVPKEREPERDTIVVGVDGSPQSFGAMMTGVELAKEFGKRLELVSVYDPYLHYAVFNSIVDVLSEKASKVFRFEEQNQLHEEVIDTGLAQIYQSHLNVGESMAKQHGVEVTKTLLDGKAFQKILGRAREVEPWLLIIGKIGVHSDDDEQGLGSNSENLLRLAPCDVLLSTRLEHPELDVRAEESILWTSEAEDRMARVPQTVRGIARRGILRLALEQGHSVVTNSVIEEAMDRFMPKATADLTSKLAARLALEEARSRDLFMCAKCGTMSRIETPVQCSVCGEKEFEQISAQQVERIVSEEGGVEEETTFDGRKIKWSTEARKQLIAIEDKYQKRRAKARIEKAARMKRLQVISVEFARAVIEDEIGKVLFDTANGSEASQLGTSTYKASADEQVVAVDEKGVEFRSAFEWSEDAAARMLQIPSGFMRDRNQERVENFALDRKRERIDLELVEEGLEQGRQRMTDMLRTEGFISDEQASAVTVEKSEPGKCPFSAILAGEDPSDGRPAAKTESHVYKGAVQHMMNEVGIMSKLKEKRDRIVPSGSDES